MNRDIMEMGQKLLAAWRETREPVALIAFGDWLAEYGWQIIESLDVTTNIEEKP